MRFVTRRRVVIEVLPWKFRAGGEAAWPNKMTGHMARSEEFNWYEVELGRRFFYGQVSGLYPLPGTHQRLGIT